MTNTKIDKRRHYILQLDTETANVIALDDGKLDMDNVLVYDLGLAVIDTHGRIYEEHSLVNADIFLDEASLMQSAYYAEKLPSYYVQLHEGTRIMTNTFGMKKLVADLCKKYGIKEICAHNARFDYKALNITQRWVTKSKYRYFFPYGTIMWDTMKMANDVICKQKRFIDFCKKNNFLTKQGRVKRTAEVLYRYISTDVDFVEKHTGLEDVRIETAILAYCFRQHKKMRKKLFENA